MSGAREEVLARVRSALRDVPAGEEPDVKRSYRLGRGEPGAAHAALFAERVADYEASVRQVERDGVAAAIAEACGARGARRLAAALSLPQGWRPAGLELVEDSPPLSAKQLDSLDGVITGCALAIAETGTVVLEAGPRQGRRALTLVPDFHICVVEEEQIVGTVPEAVARLEAVARAGRPLTFVSGPSATSDIELDRVEGVHGPRALHVLIVAAPLLGGSGERDAP